MKKILFLFIISFNCMSQGVDRPRLISDINTNINTNGTQKITGPLLNSILQEIVNSDLNKATDPYVTTNPLSGSGTNNTITLWTPNGSTLGNSFLSQQGHNVKLASGMHFSANDTSTSIIDFGTTGNERVFISNSGIHFPWTKGLIDMDENNGSVVISHGVGCGFGCVANSVSLDPTGLNMYSDFGFATLAADSLQLQSGKGGIFPGNINIGNHYSLSGGKGTWTDSVKIGNHDAATQVMIAGTLSYNSGAQQPNYILQCDNTGGHASWNSGLYDASGNSSVDNFARLLQTSTNRVVLSYGDTTMHGIWRILDGNQGNGKVLTSDGSGNATWQTPSGGGGGLDSTLTSGHIFVGNSSNVAKGVALTLNVTAGSFLLSNAGVLTMPNATTSLRGLLSSTDWNTFNGKQASGNYITALTGDVTASGPGSVAATLSNTAVTAGSYGSSTAIPAITVDAKGRITAASTNVVIAPAGTVTGTALASNVTASSLLSAAGGSFGSNAFISTSFVPYSGATGNVDLNNHAVVNTSNVGIGTTTPLTVLDIKSTQTGVNRGVLLDQYSTYGSSTISVRRAKGSISSPSAIGSTDSIGRFTAWGHDGTNFIQAGSLAWYSAGAVSTGIVPSKFEIKTMTTAGALSPAITADNNQNVGIGSVSPAAKLDINGTVKMLIGSDATGDIYYNGGTGALTRLADAATGNALISGGAGVPPSYGKIGLTTHVSGILGSTNGGSGINNAGTLTWGSGGTLGTAAYTSAGAYEVPLTFSTGLTRTTNTITINLSVGVSGGQTAIGGTAATDGLELRSTTGTGTTDFLKFTTGTNGGTESMRITHLGIPIVGSTSASSSRSRMEISTNSTQDQALHLNCTNAAGQQGIITDMNSSILDNNVFPIWRIATSGTARCDLGLASNTAIAFADPSTGHWGFVIDVTDGAQKMWSPGKAVFGSRNATPTAMVHIVGSTTAAASLRITAGTPPTSPNDGDMTNNSSTHHLVVNLNGTNYQLDQQGVSNYAHNISTPTTGGTVALTNNQYNIINPAGALLALTVNLPSSPANNDVVYIKYTQNITTVTYGNGTVVDGITAPTAGGLTVLTYDTGTTSWY